MQENVVGDVDPRVLGRRLQESRRARGLTQQEVADSLELARTTVTALEKGERRIRPDELISLAELYGRPVSSFVGSRAPSAEFSVQFRTSVNRASSPQAQQELRRGVQEFQDLCEDYLWLETIAGARSRQSYPPQYEMAGFPPEDAAEDVATSERNRLGLGDGPGLNLREILENDVGLRIFYTQLPSNLAGIFAYTEDLGGCIAVNSRHPEERRRWSMAHEYGHFLTSRFRPELTALGRGGRAPASERFADSFAGALLMPTAGLRRRFYQISRAADGAVTAAEVCRLAHYYFVSVEAMLLRLEELRLVPGGAWERLRDRGFRVRVAQQQLGLSPHPHDDASIAEAHRRTTQLSPHPHDDAPLPLRYQFLAVQAHVEGELTEGELCRVLRRDRLSTRETVQNLTHSLHLLHEGDLMAIPIDPSSRVTGT